MCHVFMINKFFFKGLNLMTLQWLTFYRFIEFMEKENKVSAYIIYRIIDFDNNLYL